MISSSLATAMRGQVDAEQRAEMFDIAAKEAARLEKLTSDFLNYAKPKPPVAIATSVSDTIGYIADVCRAHAGQRGVEVKVQSPEKLLAQIDPGQVQQALLNVVMNAVDASQAGKTVWLRATRNGGGTIQIDVENQGTPIAEKILPQIFEPFVTSKPTGTGLGLAIARNIARANGGDLVLAANRPERVCFSLTLPLSPERS